MVRSVIGHKIEQNLKPATMGLREQIVEIVKAAEARIDAAIVGNVVAVISHRRGIDGRDPDRRDAQLNQIVEPPLDPLEVTYAVAIRILKRARVDLVDYARLPPERRHTRYLWHVGGLPFASL